MYIKLSGKQAIFLKSILNTQIDDLQDKVGDYEFLEDEDEDIDNYETINNAANCLIDVYEQLDGVEEKELEEIIEMFVE